MADCILCLDDSLPSRYYIDLTSEQGVNLNILQVIKKLFGFMQFKSNSGGHICLECWKIVSEFDNFYQRICLSHRSSGSCIDRDPLPEEVYIKSVENQSLEDIEGGGENFFVNHEIKVEVNEFDLFSQTEDPDDTALKNQKTVKNNHIDQEPKVSDTLKDTDSDSDIPLSEYWSFDKKTKVLTKEENNECPLNIISDFPITIVDPEDVYSASDNGSDFDWSTSKNAEILKPKVVKPRKYEKRKKRNPSVRLSRKELAKRKSQQTTYNDIISNFFNKIPCPKCNQSLQNFDDMKRHFRTSHNIETGYITCCGRKFYLRRHLAEHLLVHSNPEHFKCRTCNRVFQDSRSLDVHENSHTNPPVVRNKNIFKCDKCPKTFTTKAGFEYHCFSKHVPKSEFKFTCSECSKKLPTKRKLKDHIKHVHDPESAIICDKCGKQVRTQANLKRHHQLEHSDEPKPTPAPVQCEICGTWLRHLSGLKQHKKTIHEEAGGDYRCHICNKTSTNARALKRHIYHNHQCERKFKCTMCDKAFKRPQDLREHTSTHTGEVLYTCPNCPMTFFSNANMYKHRQRLHRAEWESDRKNRNTNIMRQAVVGATATMKLREVADVNASYFINKAKTSLDSFLTTRVDSIQ